MIKAGIVLNNLYRQINLFFVPILMTLLGCHQLILSGYPYGHDWIFELVRISEYFNALASGQSVPFWGNNLYNGYGSPVFTFYAPLYSAISSIGLFFGFSITTSAILTLIIFSLISAIGMTLLMQEIIGDKNDAISRASIRVAAVIYVMSPYLLANMLLRNASAEFIALCIAPYPLLGVLRIFKNKKNGFQNLTLGLAAIILAHNLSALLMATILLLITLILYSRKKQFYALKQSIIAQLIGIGMTTWFWLPAFGLKSYVRVSELQIGKLDFHDNFSNLYELFSYSYFYSIGIFPLIILTLSIFTIRKNNKYFLLIIFLIIASVIFILLQTPASVIVWENIPFLPLFQFPWRMMGPLAIISAILTGLLFKCHIKKAKRFEAILIIVIVINALPQFYKYKGIPENVIEHVPRMTTSEGIRKLGLPITVGDEYLPIFANKEIISKTDKGDLVIFDDSEAVLNIIQAKNSKIKFITESSKPITLNIARWYFPNWLAEVNGESYKLNYNNDGLISINLGAGKHDVNVWLAQSYWRVLGFFFSIILLLLFIYLNNNKI